jgi:hypothetical protein
VGEIEKNVKYTEKSLAKKSKKGYHSNTNKGKGTVDRSA